MNKEKGLLIPKEKLIEIIGKYCSESVLPNGCLIEGIYYDARRMSFVAVIYHDSFPERFAGYELELMTMEG